MTGDNSENCTGVVSKLCRKTVSGKKIVTGFLLIRLKGTKLKKSDLWREYYYGSNYIMHQSDRKKTGRNQKFN
jgi:hypothetical protein